MALLRNSPMSFHLLPYGMSTPASVCRDRIRNWHAYHRALSNQGRLTLWCDEQAIAGWRHTAPATGPGAPRRSAELAVECTLVCKSVSPLSSHAAHGFLSSVMELKRLTLPIPNDSTVSRRQTALAIRSALPPCGRPRHVVVDATGLKGYGAGAWRVRKHRLRRRRTWRKLHLGIDERTKEIVAVAVTEGRVHDSRPLPALLAHIADPIAHVSGDGAYDTCVRRGCAPAWGHARLRAAAHGPPERRQGAYGVACYPKRDPPAECRPRTLNVTDTEQGHASEYCRECDVPLHVGIRRPALGTEPGDPTRRGGGERRDAQLNDAIGHARDGARGMNRALARVNCL